MKQLIALIVLLLISASSLADEDLYLKAGGYGCAACHGKYAHGGNNVGGNIRGATLAKLNQALASEPTMQLLAPTLDLQQRESLVKYLAELDQYQLVEWRLSDEATITSEDFTDARPLQLVLFNATLKSITLDLTPIGQSTPLIIAPYDTQSVEWHPKQSSYNLTINQQQLLLKKQ